VTGEPETGEVKTGEVDGGLDPDGPPTTGSRRWTCGVAASTPVLAGWGSVPGWTNQELGREW